MYENELHLYNGLTETPDPKLITDSVMGAFIGFAVGSTLCYTYEFKPKGDVPLEMYFHGGGPEKLKPGQLNQNAQTTFKLLAKLVDQRPNFGQRVMDLLTEGDGNISDQMERSFEWMTLYQAANSEEVLGFVLGPVVMGYPHKSLTISRLVQNHPVTDAVVWDFHMVMREAIIYRRALHSQDLYGGKPVRIINPDGKVTTTFNNAVVWAYQGLPFDRTMALICSNGGHTTMTGAIAGALMGAIRGVQGIPHVKQLKDLEWITRLGEEAARQITGC